MVDDRKRRAGSVYGIERSSFARGKTEPGTNAIPVEVDPEITEPPTDLAELTDRLWPLRHLDKRVERAESKVDAFTQSFARLEAMFNEFALPALKDAMCGIDGLMQRSEANTQRLEFFFEKQWPELQAAVDKLVERVGRVETSQDKLAQSISTHHDRIQRAEMALLEIERRIGIIELDKRDSRVISQERQRWLSWGKAAYPIVAALAGALGYLAHNL